MSKKDQGQQELNDLMATYQSTGISRRDFLRNALLLGMSLPMATLFLANASPALAKAAGQSTAPVKGGTFIEGYDRDFQPVEPISPGWDDPTLVAVYEYPLIRDPNGKPVPMVAESWTVAPDGLTWTFKIRDGLKFQSGAPCTNAQILQNYKAFADDKLG